MLRKANNQLSEIQLPAEAETNPNRFARHLERLNFQPTYELYTKRFQKIARIIEQKSVQVHSMTGDALAEARYLVTNIFRPLEDTMEQEDKSKNADEGFIGRLVFLEKVFNISVSNLRSTEARRGAVSDAFLGAVDQKNATDSENLEDRWGAVDKQLETQARIRIESTEFGRNEYGAEQAAMMKFIATEFGTLDLKSEHAKIVVKLVEQILGIRSNTNNGSYRVTRS